MLMTTSSKPRSVPRQPSASPAEGTRSTAFWSSCHGGQPDGSFFLCTWQAWQQVPTARPAALCSVTVDGERKYAFSKQSLTPHGSTTHELGRAQFLGSAPRHRPDDWRESSLSRATKTWKVRLSPTSKSDLPRAQSASTVKAAGGNSEQAASSECHAQAATRASSDVEHTSRCHQQRSSSGGGDCKACCSDACHSPRHHRSRQPGSGGGAQSALGPSSP